MRRLITLTAAGLLASSVIAAGPQAAQQPADPVATLELEIGESDSATGGPSAGINPYNFSNDDSTYNCESGPDGHCQVVLVKVSNPYEEENAKKGRERANLSLDLSSTAPVADFALQVYESDESGARGEYITYADDNPGTEYESMTVLVTTTEEVTEFWYRVEIIYWAAAGDFTLDVDFSQ